MDNFYASYLTTSLSIQTSKELKKPCFIAHLSFVAYPSGI
jgi:hypothetical protein